MRLFLQHSDVFLVAAFFFYILFEMSVGPTQRSAELGPWTPSALYVPYKIERSVKNVILPDDSASDISDETRASSVCSCDGQDDSTTQTTEEDCEIQDESPADAPRAWLLKLPTEMLQAIFLELPDLDSARAVTGTCRRMRDAFKGYKKIIWTIISRELGPTLPGTLGALAIFASPQKGPYNEPILRNLAISTRYWAPTLMENEELAKKMITLGMADQMLAVYRQFPKKIGYEPHKSCSACVSSRLVEDVWDPRRARTNDNCMEHLLQANAVRYRLNCRMILGYTAPDGVPEDNDDIESNWDPSRIIGEIMQKVRSDSDGEPDSGHESDSDDESIPDDESILEDDLNLEDLELENNSGYESMSDQEDEIHPEEMAYLEGNICPEYPDDIDAYPEYDIYPQGEVFVKDSLYEEDGVCQKYRMSQVDELYQEDKLYQENELYQEFYQNDFEQWMESDEALSLLDKIR